VLEANYWAVHDESGLLTTFTAETAEFAENAFGLSMLSALGVLGGCHDSESGGANEGWI
jgi:hypothetical protein